MKHIPRILALPAALAATLVLASCGSSHPSDGSHNGQSASGTTANAPRTTGTTETGAQSQADVTFATGMIPHHAQAVEMADMAPKQAVDPKVKALAAKIKHAQGPEIARMSGWLASAGAPVPGTAGGHDMSGMGGKEDGMMSPDQMTNLVKATGSPFDRMWLQAMTQHHDGAVALAKDELALGISPDAKKLAQSIIDSQSAEMAEMKSILAGMPG
jgi:uncharacterized protein (DUF305 family)